MLGPKLFYLGQAISILKLTFLNVNDLLLHMESDPLLHMESAQPTRCLIFIYLFIYIFGDKRQHKQRQIELKLGKCAHIEGRQGPSGAKHGHVRSNNTQPPPRTTH
jgi:hypothetical protein